MNRPEIPPFAVFDAARRHVIGIAAHPTRSAAVLAALAAVGAVTGVPSAGVADVAVDEAGAAPSPHSLWVGYGSTVWDEMLAAGYTPAEIVADVNAAGPLPTPFLPQWWTPNPSTVAARDARLAQVSVAPADPMEEAYSTVVESVRTHGTLTADAAGVAVWLIASSGRHPAFDPMDFPHPEAFFAIPAPTVDRPYLSHDTTCTTERYAKPAGVLAAMLYVAAFEHLLAHDRYAQHRWSAPVLKDAASGDHRTHDHGDKIDATSSQIASGGAAVDGPAFNRDSPNYDPQFTQDLVTILLGAQAPDGGRFIERIEFDDPSIRGVAPARGHRQHAHIDARVDREESDEIVATPNTGSWCEYTDVWASWDTVALDTKRAGYPTPAAPETPAQPAELPPPPVGSAAVPGPHPDPVGYVNSLPYAVGDPGPFIDAYRVGASARGWSPGAIDEWLPFMLDVAGKESGFCWNLLRGARVTGDGCEIATREDGTVAQGHGTDAGFGQVIELHLPLLASEGLTSKWDIIASPWNSLTATLRLVEEFGHQPWCYIEADGTPTVHDCTLAPARKPLG